MRKHEDVFQGLKCGGLLSQVLLPPPRMGAAAEQLCKAGPLHLSSCCVTKHLCKESELNIWRKVFLAETFRALKVRLNSDYQTEQHETEKRRNGRKASRAAVGERLKICFMPQITDLFRPLRAPEFCFNQPSLLHSSPESKPAGTQTPLLPSGTCSGRIRLTNST